MSHVARTKLVGTFDREPFIGAILLGGALISITCLIAGTAWQRITAAHWVGTETLQGTSVVGFLAAGFHQVPAIGWRPTLLFHVGIAALWLIPYLRTLGSCWYFAYVERNARYALLTGSILAVMTYILIV